MSQLPWVTYFAARSSSSLGSYQLPMASQLEVGLHADLSPPPGCFVWLELAQVMFMLSQVLWVHICNCPVVYRKYHFIPLALSTLFFGDDPQALVNMLISVLIFLSCFVFCCCYKICMYLQVSQLHSELYFIEGGRAESSLPCEMLTYQIQDISYGQGFIFFYQHVSPSVTVTITLIVQAAKLPRTHFLWFCMGPRQWLQRAPTSRTYVLENCMVSHHRQ